MLSIVLFLLELLFDPVDPYAGAWAKWWKRFKQFCRSLWFERSATSVKVIWQLFILSDGGYGAAGFYMVVMPPWLVSRARTNVPDNHQVTSKSIRPSQSTDFLASGNATSSLRRYVLEQQLSRCLLQQFSRWRSRQQGTSSEHPWHSRWCATSLTWGTIFLHLISIIQTFCRSLSGPEGTVVVAPDH